MAATNPNSASPALFVSARSRTGGKPKRSILTRVLSAVPFVGYAGRLLSEERMPELGLFIGNAVMAVVLLVWLFGFPALITILQALTLLMGLVVVMLTRGDLNS